MKNILFLAFSFSFVFIACNNNKAQKSIDDITALEANPSLANSDTLIHCYTRFSETFPEHKLAPVFLFKAAQSLMQSNRVLLGTKLYDKMGVQYESDTLAPEALIRAGVGYQTVSDPANAIRVFEIFVKRYPKHPRVDEIKKNIEYAGLSDEEFLKKVNEEILKKSGENVSVTDSIQ